MKRQRCDVKRLDRWRYTTCKNCFLYRDHNHRAALSLTMPHISTQEQQINFWVQDVTNRAYQFANQVVQTTLRSSQLPSMIDGNNPSVGNVIECIPAKQYYVQIVRCTEQASFGVVCAPPQNSGIIMDSPLLVTANSLASSPVSLTYQRGGQVSHLAVMPVSATNSNFRSTDILCATPFSVILVVEDIATEQILIRSSPFNFGDIRNADQFGLIPESVIALGTVIPYNSDVRVSVRRIE